MSSSLKYFSRTPSRSFSCSLGLTLIRAVLIPSSISSYLGKFMTALAKISIFVSNAVFWSFIADSIIFSFSVKAMVCSFIVAAMAPSLISSVVFLSARTPFKRSIFASIETVCSFIAASMAPSLVSSVVFWLLITCSMSAILPSREMV